MPLSPLCCEEQDGATAIDISCDLLTAQIVLNVAATVGIVSVVIGYSGVKRRLTGRVRRLNTNFSALAYVLAAWGLYVWLQSWDSHHGVLMDELSGASIAVTWLLVAAATYVTRDWSCRPFGWIRRALSVLALALSLALLGVKVYTLRDGDGVAATDVVLSVGAILVLGAEVIISWRLPLASPSAGSALLAGINDLDGLGVPLLGTAASNDTQMASDVPRREFPQGPESRSSILSRLTFWWITPLLSKGYRQKSLGPDDLPPLEVEDQPAFTHAAFRRRWEKVRAEMLRRRSEIEQRGGANKRSSGWQLLKTILWVNWGSFWACGGVLLLSTAVGLSVPMVLNMLLSHIEDGGVSDGGAFKGYALAVGLFILAVLQSLTEHQFWVCGVRCGMRAQSALMAETFRKALCLEPESRRGYSPGELINLMSVDACRVADVSIVPMVHWGTWCAVVMLVVSLVSLYTLLGYSAFVGVAVVLVFWPIGYLLGKQGKRAAMVIQQERDRRSRLMSEALESIRLLKSLQWEAFASSVLQSARRREVGAQIRRSVCFGGNGTLAQIAQVFGPLAAFTFRVLVEGKPLTAAVAFTSLAWFNLLKRPLNILPSALTSLLDCLVSFERLEALFLTDEVISPCSAISSTESASPPSSTEALPGTGPSPPRGPEHSRSTRYLKPSPSTEEIPQSEDATWALELNNCTLSWSRRGPPAVRDINLRIRKGELVVVVGPVGAGKSTLLQSLVGDCLEVSGRGSVSVHGRVALVGQSPWVQDTSVRENVVFGASIGFDRARFNEVVRCCGLTKDLALLASRGGEMMGTGEGGIGLSGGQRQRLGLARAVYSDPDICLLDDVLSSLDVPVGRQIWEECLVKFMGDKTRVVVTHQTHFLQHPAVDRVVVIDDLGCMRAVGSYRQLLTSGDRFVVDTVLGHGNGKELQHECEATSEDVVLASEGGETKEVWMEAEERGSICKVGGLLGETQPMFGGDAAEPEEEMVAFMETEDRRKGGLELGLLLTYLQRFGGPGMLFPVLTLALFVLEQGVNVLQWFWLSRLTGESDRATDEEHVQQSRIYVLMALGGALCVITASRILTLMYGAVTAGNSLHSSMLSALLKAPVRFFDRQPSGRILNRFIADQAAIDSIVPGTLADFFQQLLYFGATLVVLCYALPEMVPVVIILALPYWAVSTYYRWPARDLRRLEAVSKSPVNSQFSEAVRGVSVIRAFNAQQRFLQKHLELSAHNISCYWTKWVANQWVTIWLELIGTVFMLGCAVLTVWVTTPGEAPAVLASHVDAGKMGLVMSYAVLVPTNLGWLLKVYFMAEIEFIAVERVAQYVGLESEDNVRTAAATASQTEREEEKLLVAVHDQGAADSSGAALSLTARDVCMRYGESDKLTLKGMDLNVRAGEKAAIVGRTGAGKSSVFQLLLGFYGPELGSSCKVDGEEVVCMPTPSLRRKVRLIPQTPTLFGVTVRGVLTADSNSDHDVAIWAALERVQMANAVRELPEGLHTPLADIEFSAGERQLLCIARALLNPAPVLLCDEVTSAIDLRTDTTIHDVILSLPSTVLLICHRLHRIREFDRVIVMDQGVTVEEGKPDDLLKNPMSHLSDMMRSADMSASGF